jgi:hypothetical protein
MTLIVTSLQVSKGYLSYDQKISEIWKEFGQGKKENITVQELLRHEGGLFHLLIWLFSFVFFFFQNSFLIILVYIRLSNLFYSHFIFYYKELHG